MFFENMFSHDERKIIQFYEDGVDDVSVIAKRFDVKPWVVRYILTRYFNLCHRQVW